MQSIQYKNKSICALILARCGSKRVQNKNIKKLCGRPLIYWCLKELSKVNQIEKIYVATDSFEYIKIIEKLEIPNIFFIKRQDSTDTQTSDEALLKIIEHVKYENILLYQCTSPLVTKKTISKAIQKYIKSDCKRDLISLIQESKFEWYCPNLRFATPMFNLELRPRTQDFCKYYESGAFYISSKERIYNNKTRVSSQNCIPFVIPKIESFEIDTLEDFKICEAILNARNQNNCV